MYCSFEFYTFPFDSHHCDLRIGSSQISIYYLRLLPLEIHNDGEITNFGQKVYVLQEKFQGKGLRNLAVNF